MNSAFVFYFITETWLFGAALGLLGVVIEALISDD